MRGKNALFNIISSLSLNIVVFIFGLIVPKIIINNYGSNINGVVTSITQFLAYITLLESGIGPVVKATLYKPIAKNEKEKIRDILRASEKFFHVISYIFLAYLIILSFVYPIFVNDEFGYWFSFSLVIIISISTFAEYYFGMTYKLYLQAEQKSYIVSTIQIITYIVNLIVIVLVAKIGASIQVLKLLSGLVFTLRPIIQNYYIKKKYKINLKDADDDYKLKQKWDGLAQHIASVIHNNADVTILTFFSSLSEVSVYSVYAMLMKGLKSIAQSLNEGIEAAFGSMIATDETDNLRKKFDLYEIVYFALIVVLYGCCLILITPFVKVYTSGVTDANYYRPLFGYLIVISEFLWAIRQPYNNLVKGAGHFKQTKKGAWLEAIINVVISIMLVFKFGIIGVAIGTLLAMLVRTVEFIYYTNKHILKRNVIENVKKILILVLEFVIFVIVIAICPKMDVNTYGDWTLFAFISCFICVLIVAIINMIFYRNKIKDIIHIITRVLKRK